MNESGGWWELLCAIGVIGFPLGVAGNLLASWVWSALTKPRAAIPTIKVILLEDKTVTEIHVESQMARRDDTFQ